MLSAQAVWAGAEEGVGCCTVISPGAGALAIKGTLGLAYTIPGGGVEARADAELRLERTGLRGFFLLLHFQKGWMEKAMKRLSAVY